MTVSATFSVALIVYLKRCMKVLQLLLLTSILIAVIVFASLQLVARGSYGQVRSCDAENWGKARLEDMIDEIIRKRGGFPQQSSVVFVAQDESYPSFNRKQESVLRWEIRNPEIWIDDDLQEKDFALVADIDVIFTDGNWRRFEFDHTRYGTILKCDSRPLSMSQFNAPMHYETKQTLEELELIVEEVVTDGVKELWTYKIFRHPTDDYRVIQMTSLADLTTVENLLAFKEYNEHIAQGLANTHDDYDAQLLFNDPLSVQETIQLMRRNEIEPMTVFVMSLNMHGETITWPLELNGDVEQLRNGLRFSNRFLDRTFMAVEPSELEIIGIVSATGKVKSERHNAILEDENVALLDLTYNLLNERVLAVTGKPISTDDMIKPLSILQTNN